MSYIGESCFFNIINYTSYIYKKNKMPNLIGHLVFL